MKKRAVFLLIVFVLSLLAISGRAQEVASNQPLTLPELNNLLRRAVGRNMTEGDLAVRIDRLGIAFDPTPEAISRLRAAGAHPHLINAVKRAGERLMAAAGAVVATRAATPDPIIEEVRKNALSYVQELPDFICQQEITRYLDNGTGAWEKADTLVYELTYNRMRESYKPINTIGRPLTRPLDQAGGTISTGEFGSTLAEILRPETKALFKPAGMDKLGSRKTLIYDFRVPQASSKFTIKVEPALPIMVGYSGSLWVDAETKQVLRIELAVDNLPADYPATQAEKTIDYDIIKLRGLDLDFLLPVRAEAILADRRQRQYSRNLIYFKFYRKFETDIKIVDDPPPIKPPGQ
jgi:hypothetical protein